MSDAHRDETRRLLHDLLLLLSDREAQRAYERDVPIANVPAELLSMWFDDIYHPSSDRFGAAFSDDERAELAAFNDSYRARADDLPTTGGVAALHGTPEWDEVVERASAALLRLGWETSD